MAPVVPVILNNNLDGGVRESVDLLGILERVHHRVALLARVVNLGHIEPVVLVKFLQLIRVLTFDEELVLDVAAIGELVSRGDTVLAPRRRLLALPRDHLRIEA